MELLSDGTKVSAQTSCPAQIERDFAVCKEAGVKINKPVASGLNLEALASGEAVVDSVEARYGNYQRAPDFHGQ